MKEYIVSEEERGRRVDRFVQEKRADLSRIFVLKAIRLKKIRVNGRRTEGSARLEAGDRVQVYLAEAGSRPVRTDGFTVAYEDASVIVVNKKRGVACEDSTGKAPSTLLSQVNAYLGRKGEKAALCHRIDYNTAGLVLLAKDEETLSILERSIRMREIGKRYLCVVCGRVVPKSGELRHQLFKDAKKNRVYLSDEPVKGSRTAVTRYTCLESRGGLSLVECELVTGRTHQIRSQMARAGWPILGDEKYGSKAANRPYGERRQLLTAYRLTFPRWEAGSRLAALSGRTITLGEVDFREKYFGK